MVIHPNLEWLQDIESNIQDADWRYKNLDLIMESLDGYLSNVDYVLSASGILYICFENMLGQGRYAELMALHHLALNTFDSPNPISLLLDETEHSGLSNAERFPNEYFLLKVNLTHAALMLHEAEVATQQLADIRQLYPKATRFGQLEACCMFLKYYSHGYEIDLDFDLITTTQELSNKYFDELRIKGESAIAYYYYSKGNISEMEKVLRKTNRIMAKSTLDRSKIGAILAEQNFYLAVMYRELGEFEKAFAKLDIASDQFARLNNHVQNMLVQYETAMIYHTQHHNEKALDWINQAYKEFEHFREKQDYHRAMLDHGKGAILLDLKQFDYALTLFQRVLLIWEKHKHDYHMALAINGVGAVNIHLERPTEALEYFAKALTICDQISDRSHVRTLMKVIDNNVRLAKSKL